MEMVPKEIREATTSLITALHALSPSRNEIARYIKERGGSTPSSWQDFDADMNDFPWMKGIPKKTYEFLRRTMLHDIGEKLYWVKDSMPFQMRPEEKEALFFLTGIKKEELPNPKEEYEKGRRSQMLIEAIQRHKLFADDNEIQKEARNFVKALIAVSPSRNIISRAYVLTRGTYYGYGKELEYLPIDKGYPTFQEIKESMEIVFEFLERNKIFPWTILEFVKGDTSRRNLEFFTEMPIPDLRKEFGLQLLETIKQDKKNGENMIKILEFYKNSSRLKVKEIMEETGLNIEEIKEALKAFSAVPYIISADSRYRGTEELDAEDEIAIEHWIPELIIEVL